MDSLIEHYPNFNARLRESLRALVGEEVERRVDIGMAKDGSGVGGEYSLLVTWLGLYQFRSSCTLCSNSHKANILKPTL